MELEQQLLLFCSSGMNLLSKDCSICSSKSTETFIVALVLFTFGSFILRFHLFLITRLFVCGHSSFLVSVMMTPSSLNFVRLPTDRSQVMHLQIEVVLSYFPFRLIDIHEISRIVWVWHMLWNSLCFWSHTSIVRTSRTEIRSALPWLFEGISTENHEEFSSTYWSSRNDLIFL